MKKIFYALLIVTALSSCCTEKKFTVFGVKLSPQDIVGTDSYNDLGMLAHTDVINNLTDDPKTFFWRLGAVRIDKNNYKKGSYALFNLSQSANENGYPLLDAIDFQYYRDWGFNLLQSDNPKLLENAAYIDFKKRFNAANDNQAKRQFLWDDKNEVFRNLLLQTKFNFNKQTLALSQEKKRQLTLKLVASAATEISNFVTPNLTDASGQSVDTAKINASIRRALARNVNLSGNFISVTFKERYTQIAQFYISQLSQEPTGNDEFTVRLKQYIPAKNVALNSAMIAFQLDGSVDKLTDAETLLEASLQADLNITPQNATKIATALSGSFSQATKNKLENEFSKTWIIMFGTDGNLDKLEWKK